MYILGYFLPKFGAKETPIKGLGDVLFSRSHSGVMEEILDALGREKGGRYWESKVIDM